MDDLTLSPSWPAAPRSGTVLVQHPAWEAARNAVLDLAAEGPVTIFLTGEPGSGKTWLLRELATSFGSHGFPTMALLRGDLPIPLGNGVAVLVDEARYMPAATRAEMAAQDRGVVILADIEPFDDLPTDVATKPVRIHLRLLDADEVGPFAADWLKQNGLQSAILDPDALARLVIHGAGAVRIVAQLLTASVALARSSGRLHLTAALIDQVAAFRLGTSFPDPVPAPLQLVRAQPEPAQPEPVQPEPVQPEPVQPTAPVIEGPKRRAPKLPIHRLRYRWTLAGTALAASVLAVLLLPKPSYRPVAITTSAPPPRTLPPLETAQLAVPTVASAPAPPIVVAQPSEPAQANSPAPTLQSNAAPPDAEHKAAPDAVSPLQTADVSSVPTAQLAPPPPAPQATVLAFAQAASLQPIPAQPVSTQPASVQPIPPAPPPTNTATLPQASVIPVISAGSIAPTPAFIHRPATGLVLVAQRGDTLERLYADIYRDRRAPPYAEVLAANPRPFKPGGIVVFPEPIGGWSKAQR